jgi:hypothetical protein
MLIGFRQPKTKAKMKTNAQLDSSAPTLANTMLSDGEFVPSVGDKVYVTSDLGNLRIIKKAKIMNIDFENHPDNPFLVMFGRNPYLQYIGRNLISKL